MCVSYYTVRGQQLPHGAATKCCICNVCKILDCKSSLLLYCAKGKAKYQDCSLSFLLYCVRPAAHLMGAPPSVLLLTFAAYAFGAQFEFPTILCKEKTNSPMLLLRLSISSTAYSIVVSKFHSSLGVLHDIGHSGYIVGYSSLHCIQLLFGLRGNGSDFTFPPWPTLMLPRSFRSPSVKQSLQDRTDIWRNVTI